MATGVARGYRRAFRVLARQFFDQFFISESATSDYQHRQAMVGVLAFLITPGFLIPLQLSGAYEFAYFRFPSLIEPLTRLLATIFLTYAMVAIGVVSAFVWDALSFDRRDAMVIGPLPIPGRVVIGAKLAAIGALLLITATAINVMTAVPFAMIASSHKTPTAFGRHLVAHVIATTCATAFVFSGLVTLRALLGMVHGGRVWLESLLRFALVSALLCFTVLTPTSLQITAGRIAGRLTRTVRMLPIPGWSPTNWFLGLYEVVRGTSHGEFERAARVAIVVTLTAVAAAFATTIVGYHRQLRLALSPSSSRAHRSARIALFAARLFAGRNAVARASADFVVTTIARNRAQQTPIVINVAIGLALVVIGLTRSHGDFASFVQPRAITLSVPLMLSFWAAVGLRAAFYVPSELPASWTFIANAPDGTRAYRRAVCASMIAFIAPPAVFLAALVTAPTGDWIAVARHSTFVLLVVVALVEFLLLTIDFVPFTRPYRPGHAKLKTRWPLYAIGGYGFAYGMAELELRTWSNATGFLTLAACAVAMIGLLELAGRQAALRWSVQPTDEVEDDDSVTVLDIGPVVHRAHVGG